MNPSAVRWRKSTRSDTITANCVEVAGAADAIGIRDSKKPTGPNLAVSLAAFRHLIEQAKGGHFDHADAC
ncbi:DUF397 domain-containing protein [Thermomonospora umbrina]|uniref:Uncharacterized protein DUF397 n=1 Tax=Thermomonospora umbrina TaxID=111806 RepID=A0A3D9SXA9_9ACTN|nr:DUF397 domain-containing protein [Thermomonospora umbrina]REF00479.1 uncharacterized protein DUF397 [Thermomonospora umbrina]